MCSSDSRGVERHKLNGWFVKNLNFQGFILWTKNYKEKNKTRLGKTFVKLPRRSWGWNPRKNFSPIASAEFFCLSRIENSEFRARKLKWLLKFDLQPYFRSVNFKPLRVTFIACEIFQLLPNIPFIKPHKTTKYSIFHERNR